MPLNSRALVLVHILFWSFLDTFILSHGTQSDINCLKSIRDSFEDPLNLLKTSWTFNNLAEGSICNYVGVTCLNPAENRVSGVVLTNMGLKGEFPKGIEDCRELVNLDLSGNDISGSIPSSIGNCSYLEVLKLDNNKLTGQISQQLNQLKNLRIFSVANNLLSGPVPEFVNINITREGYVNNSGLCGGPLEYCKKHRWEFEFSFRSGFVVGFIFSATLYTPFFMYYINLRVGLKKKNHNKTMSTAKLTALMARRKNKNKTQPCCVSQIPTEAPRQELSKEFLIVEWMVSKISFTRLSKATNNFSASNVIGFGKTGTMYKAILLDGTFLAVKRLHASQHHENQLLSELMTLGRLRHNNLVPLMGFCLEMQEGLLVYKYMSNGSLHDWLHVVEDKGKILEWHLRVTITVGIARGLAWLHHWCDFKIVHLDISSKCILLDKNFEPKISNFGRAKSRSVAINGEFGDVELVKKDVYSFGIMLLELITGKKPSQITNLPNCLDGTLVQWNNHISNTSSCGMNDVVDKSLLGKGYDGEIFQFLTIACSCVQTCSDQRPTMLEVWEKLRAIRERYGLTDKDDYQLLRPPQIGTSDTKDDLEIIEVETH